MKTIILTEDNCLAQNKKYSSELRKYIIAGYKIDKEYLHPAVGKVAHLSK